MVHTQKGVTLECVAHEFECLIKLFENKLFEKKKINNNK